MSRFDLLLLEIPLDDVHADRIVARDGSGDVKTISEAVNRAPKNASRAFVVFIKAGMVLVFLFSGYAENNLTIWQTKTNLWLLGEGIETNIITGKKCASGGVAVEGARLVARGITFLNEAGPEMGQAVALLVMADRTVLHQCEILATKDLKPVKSTYPTYLGSPWSVRSRVSYISSYLGDHIDPRGWLAWDGTSPTDKLYYGEYKNFGLGTDTM
ncbi:hypothetical protein Cgig2_017187 [Carnegiea gigantea]|uniref:Pectinesterase catalytic domain-containing protein n=1 Tax=Carnegiea gigantea TaxID=171969 RepID=A0A9Q1Q752_9CARY|nr:hypothetical protein Cgig2_017187 [Carnegiea gigantea]